MHVHASQKSEESLLRAANGCMDWTPSWSRVDSHALLHAGAPMPCVFCKQYRQPMRGAAAKAPPERAESVRCAVCCSAPRTHGLARMLRRAGQGACQGSRGMMHRFSPARRTRARRPQTPPWRRVLAPRACWRGCARRRADARTSCQRRSRQAHHSSSSSVL